MLIIKYIIRIVLYLRYFFHKITRTNTFGPNRAEYIITPYQETENHLKNALFRHNVKQFHESSCSVASVACAINAILETTHDLHRHPVTQQEILERVKAAHWKKRMGPKGYRGRRGLPLTILGQVMKASLTAYGIGWQSLEIVQAQIETGSSRPLQENLLSRLEQFESLGNCLIIAHFDQGSFVQDLNIPHISPVGGFDPHTGKVIVLDVDPAQPHPYQISFDTFYKGLSTHYNHVFRLFGYGRGGYVFIQL